MRKLIRIFIPFFIVCFGISTMSVTAMSIDNHSGQREGNVWSAYRSVLEKYRDAISLYWWGDPAVGYAEGEGTGNNSYKNASMFKNITFVDDYVYADPRIIAFTDLDGDNIPELVFITAEPDLTANYPNSIPEDGKVKSYLRIYTYDGTTAKEVYRERWDNGLPPWFISGGGYSYVLYQLEGINGLFYHYDNSAYKEQNLYGWISFADGRANLNGVGFAEKWGSEGLNYFSNWDSEQELSIKLNPTSLYNPDVKIISEAEYNKIKNAANGTVSHVVLYGTAWFFFDFYNDYVNDFPAYLLEGSSGNFSSIAMTYDEAVQYTLQREASAGQTPFIDIDKGAYYYDAVVWAVNNGVTNGTSSTTFSPNDTVTRAQAVTILWRAMGQPAPSSIANPFHDIKETDYYYQAVLWAVEKGITAGTTATTFSPQQTCSVAHIITFLYRVLGVGTDGWYAEAGAWAEQKGILAMTGAHISPNENCPRANVVTFLYRVFG